MRKKHTRAIAGLMLMVLLVSPWPVLEVKAASTPEEDALKEMKQVAENDSLILYLDEQDTDVAVYVKETGDIWFSNPVEAENDTIASDYHIRQMKSQVALRYFNESVQESSMDNYSDAVMNGQFTIDYTENGVTVTYEMGEQGTGLLLPEVLSAERMKEFTGKMEDKAAKKFLRNYTFVSLDDMRESEQAENIEKYPGLEQHDIYTLRSSVKDYVREELAGYLSEAGYTEEDYQFDLEDNGYQSENTKPWFQIPVSYRLEGEEFVAEIDPAQITYNSEDYYLVDVDLLPFFGAAGKEEEGYIFVPDGCGALIRLNNGSNASAYGAKVYGQDMTMISQSAAQSEIDPSLTIKMPVFGLKSNDKAWMAVIEDGDGYADIQASVSGQNTSYNAVNAGFQYLEYGASSLGSMVGSNSFQMYSNPSFTGTYKLRFFFLNGEDADYSGMAGAYRGYLQEKGILAERTESTDVPFYAEYIGAIDKYATFLGIKHKTVCPTTTYRQAAEITDQLLAGGVSNVNLIYSGWANGGLHGSAYTKISEVGKLSGGGMDREKFQKEIEQRGVNLFFTAELQYVYKDELMDGYSALQNAPKYFDRSSVYTADYYLDTREMDTENLISLISPVYVSKVSDALSKKASKLGGAGLNLGTISYNLYSDQLEENYTDRQAAIEQNSVAARQLTDAYDGRIMGDNANSYMLGAVSDLINTPMASNRSLILDEEVPFYQMVLHGYMDYAGDCLNLTDDYNTALLKSVESGAGLYFMWMYEDNSIVKETDYDDLYSVNYEAWLDTALKDYERVNEALGDLQGETIIEHELISEKVVRVTYEKGTQILVNYSTEDVTVDGVTVKARDYAVVKQHE